MNGGNPLPFGSAETGFPVVGWYAAFVFETLLIGTDVGAVGGNAVVPDVPVVLGVGAGACRLDEPLVLCLGVVENHVEDYANVSLFSLGDEVVHIGNGAVLWVYGLVVGDVVAKFDLR